MAQIVLIDDEANLLRTLARLLELQGHQVHAGTSFAAVSSHLQPGRFDLLLTDIVMPEMDGLAVLSEVVERRGCREPVVLVTGLPDLDSAAAAVRQGAFDYVQKPVTKERLLDVVARAQKHVTLLRERDRARHHELDLLRNLARLGEQASLLSHEIRTPITSLRQALYAVGEKLGLEHHALVDELIRNMERIERLLSETLSFARPLRLQVQRVQLGALIAEAVTETRRQSVAAALVIECTGFDAMPPLAIDAQLVREVVLNLLRNAAEACGGKGRIAIAARLEQGHVIVDVRDDGPGVPVSRRDEIFRPFHSSKPGGTGIGLAFSRKIVEAHAGTLELAPEPAPGACFRIRLPGEPGVDGKRDQP